MHVLSHNKTLALRPLHSSGAGESLGGWAQGICPQPQRETQGRDQTVLGSRNSTHTHESCSVNSHLFARGRGTAWREGHSRGEQQLRPQNHPKLWVLLLLLLSGQERVKPPFPLKPVQSRCWPGPGQGCRGLPLAPAVAPGHTRAQTEHRPLLQHLESPEGPSCPSLLRQAQQKQEQFLLPETGFCEGSITPQQG